jgi:hypothetical protein
VPVRLRHNLMEWLRNLLRRCSSLTSTSTSATLGHGVTRSVNSFLIWRSEFRLMPETYRKSSALIRSSSTNACRGRIVIREQIILTADGDTTQRPFSRIVVESEPAVIEASQERLPA